MMIHNVYDVISCILLIDRIEKLASRLLQVDKEKTSLQHQLNAEKTKQQTSNRYVLFEL